MNIIDEINAIECDEAALVIEWERIVRAGKRSKKLRRNAKVRKKDKDDPKYYDPECIGKTGAIKADEYVFLHKLVKYFKPENIIETGTWFGTSANAMASALDGGGVYTCDKYDLYVAPRDNIIYWNCLSTKLIDALMKERAKIDMAFWDAKFMRGDSDKLVKMIKPMVFVTHDYEHGEKGWRNIQELKEKGDYQFDSHGIIGVLYERLPIG